MKEIINLEQAEELHKKILNSGRIAEQALVEFAKDLKQMKDTKLYKALGYKTFALYCEQAICLKSRQVYNYIYVLENNDKDFVHSSAHLGIKKLQLLTELHNTDKKKFVKEKHNINGKEKTVEEMTTREVEKEVKKQKELYTDSKEDKEVKPKVNNNEDLDKAIKRQQELEREIKEQEQKIKNLKENILLNSENILEDASVEFEEVIDKYGIINYNIYFIKGKTKILVEDKYSIYSFKTIDITNQYSGIVWNVNSNKTLIQEEKDFILAECLKFKEQALKRYEEDKKQQEEEERANEGTFKDLLKDLLEEMLREKLSFTEDEQKMLKNFYKTLLMKYHPDKGGTKEEILLVYKLKDQWGI